MRKSTLPWARRCRLAGRHLLLAVGLGALLPGAGAEPAAPRAIDRVHDIRLRLQARDAADRAAADNPAGPVAPLAQWYNWPNWANWNNWNNWQNWGKV